MENVIVYQIHSEAKQEISELFRNKGYTPFFAHTLSEFNAIMDHTECSKTYMYINNISEIQLLQTVKSVYEKMEINLIIPPQLHNIIELLKNNNFKILKDVTQIQWKKLCEIKLIWNYKYQKKLNLKGENNDD